MWAAYFEGDGLTLRLFYPFTRIPSEPAMTRKKEESGNEAMVEAIERGRPVRRGPPLSTTAVVAALGILGAVLVLTLLVFFLLEWLAN